MSCDQQSFGKCSQWCRQGVQFEFGYECYCEKGYILLSDHRTCLVFGTYVHSIFIACFDLIILIIVDPFPQLLVANAYGIVTMDIVYNKVYSLLSLSHLLEDFDYNFDSKVCMHTIFASVVPHIQTCSPRLITSTLQLFQYCEKCHCGYFMCFLNSFLIVLHLLLSIWYAA